MGDAIYITFCRWVAVVAAACGPKERFSRAVAQNQQPIQCVTMDPGKAKVLREEVFQNLTAYARSIHSNVVSVFRSRDRDQSGALSTDEMSHLLTDLLGGDITQPQVQAVMARFDKNRNGVIEYDEMLRTIQEWQREKRACGSGTRTSCNPALLARLYTKAPGSVYAAREQRVERIERSTLRPWHQSQSAHMPSSRAVPKSVSRLGATQSTNQHSSSGKTGLIARFSSRSRAQSAHLGRTRSSVGSSDSRWWNAEANQGRRPEGSATRSQLQSRGSSQSGSRRGGSAQSRHSKHKHTSGNVRWQKVAGGYNQAPQI